MRCVCEYAEIISSYAQAVVQPPHRNVCTISLTHALAKSATCCVTHLYYSSASDQQLRISRVSPTDRSTSSTITHVSSLWHFLARLTSFLTHAAADEGGVAFYDSSQLPYEVVTGAVVVEGDERTHVCRLWVFLKRWETPAFSYFNGFVLYVSYIVDSSSTGLRLLEMIERCGAAFRM